ncbi:hypothetical protein PINS_up020687 [Pythium insidiosum]|nr:hypothetical protein PINS_up020687 [Pythium insidiosum]
MENADFQRIPDILLTMQIHYLNLAGNPIQRVDANVFMAPGLHLLVLSGTLISTLPEAVNASKVSINSLYFLETNISALPAWMDEAYVSSASILAGKTPLCREILAAQSHAETSSSSRDGDVGLLGAQPWLSQIDCTEQTTAAWYPYEIEDRISER